MLVRNFHKVTILQNTISPPGPLPEMITHEGKRKGRAQGGEREHKKYHIFRMCKIYLYLVGHSTVNNQGHY